ncbi:MAG: TraR/DksA C4-type zinc finger protein [Candidatus Pacebacteria bacterium]|nr:TraR/DksA C4-type zinc finger protein [Candidatus Paceibacterota bacterium]
MDKKIIEELKEKLEKEKLITEKALEKFAQRDEKVKGDWDTRFPRFDGGESGDAALEKAADEVEEYSTLLPLEYNLETQLKDINSALEKIKKGTYGKCEKCDKEIDEERLKIHPTAKFCMTCEKK